MFVFSRNLGAGLQKWPSRDRQSDGQHCFRQFGSKSVATRIRRFSRNFRYSSGYTRGTKLVLKDERLSVYRFCGCLCRTHSVFRVSDILSSFALMSDPPLEKFSPKKLKEINSFYTLFQIVVGGRNKYLINGVNAQNQRVHDLFQSVSLNVNNPHFLIMQVTFRK